MDANTNSKPVRVPWNKGKVIGQKAALKPKDIWSIRVRLQIQHRAKELALFNLGFDSKLRGCDFGGVTRARRLSWRADSQPGDGDAAKDAPTCSV
jgi:hypothetical protein